MGVYREQITCIYPLDSRALSVLNVLIGSIKSRLRDDENNGAFIRVAGVKLTA
jgi:hypothetical protein